MTEDGEVLVRVVRIDTTILKQTQRYRWLITFSDGRVGYVRTEKEATWFRACLDDDLELVVTVEEQSPSYAKGLPPIVVMAERYQPEQDQPF